MAIERFPPVETADEDGLLAIGGDLEVPSLLLAYSSGIFPWPFSDDDPITWFSPKERCILRLDEFHISKSLKKELKLKNFEFKINTDFREVITACSKSKNRKCNGTWITKQMIEAYIELHESGYAHSISSYLDNKLVGGLYGVAIGGMFAGESMFFKKQTASKAALCFLVEHLKAKDVDWIDCQQTTPLFESFGAKLISRDKFLKLLKSAVNRNISLF